MRDSFSSTLWRISTFYAALDAGNSSTGDPGPALIAGTVLSGLRRLQSDAHDDDLLALLSVAIRHREEVLLYLEHGPWVWPVTLFPIQRLYHAPRDVAEQAAVAPLSGLKVLGATRPTVRVSDSAFTPLDAQATKFRPLSSLLVALALQGPRSTLLAEIGGRAAYRLAPGHLDELPELPGALGAAAKRLRVQAVPLKDIALWPGMSLERGCRLLNLLYLAGGLMVTRSHPAARGEPPPLRGGSDRPR